MTLRHDDIVAEIDPRLSPLPLWQYISDTDIQYNLSIVLLVSIEENFVDKNEQCSLKLTYIHLHVELHQITFFKESQIEKYCH